MKHNIFLVSLALCAQLFAAESPPGRVVFSEDFKSTNALAPWSHAPAGVSLVAERNGQALLVSREASDGPGTVVVSTALPVDRLRGCRVRCEAKVRAAGVAQPPNVWNGIKVMLHTESPSAGPRWEQPNNIFGTFDWRTLRFTTTVPADVSLAQLALGLESTSGQVWFEEVKVTVIRDPRDAAPAQIAAGSVFKGHDLPRLRGAMVHPDITAESLGVLGDEWKANVIRWQLIRYVVPGKETALAEYDVWLENELAKLDRVLPLCAKHGLRAVIDLHSPPGGARTVSGYIGSDAGLFTNSAAQAKFVAVWRSVAHRYRDNATIWGYDLANEPVEEVLGEGCDDWQELATRAAKAIREIDARHAIIVEPTPWGGPSSIANLEPLPVPGVVYSVHMYVPQQFTHQGIQDNAAGVRYPGKIAGREWDKAGLRQALQPVIDFQRRYHVHIFLGEFSAIRWAPGASDYLRDCIELFEENDWDWTYHAFREYHGWSVEHGADFNNNQTSATVTDRKQLLLDWFAKNKKP